MQRVNKTIVEDNYYTKEEKGEFDLFYNTEKLRTYDDIKNKFKNFKLDEEYELELKNEGCPSITYLKFFLYNEEKENIYLFIIKLEISSTTDLEYEFICLSTVEDELREIHDIYENYLIKIEYETKFYKWMCFGEYDSCNEEEDFFEN